jgi:spermidine synthase
VIGLGPATIAAFGKEGDVIRFYEIDPGVSDIANTYFTYLSESKADTEIIIGDARISMESELRENQRQDYDLLVLDAFSGDGIPVHLLTREALAVYRQHLSPKGVIAIHISNRHFNLRSVVRSLADNAGLYVAWIEDPGARVGETANDWMLLTTGLELKKQLQAKASRWSKEDYEQVLWTDDYANLFAAARAE